MKKLKKQKKIDIEAELFVILLGLKEEKNKTFSFNDCDRNIVYLFENVEEYKNYFVLNGFVNINDDILKICKMKTTKKGTVIALKGLCDYAIRRHSLTTIYDKNNFAKGKKLDYLLDSVDDIHFTSLKKHKII